MDIFEVSGIKIRKMREALGWTRAELSENSGVSERTIQDVEMGVTKNPSIDTFKEILKAFPKAKNAQTYNELLGTIFIRLAALNERELRDVLAVLDSLPAAKELATAPLTKTDPVSIGIARSKK